MGRAKYPKIILSIGTGLAFIDIFLMFGELFKSDTSYHGTMASFAFGTGGWKQFGGITAIFVIQIFVILLALCALGSLFPPENATNPKKGMPKIVFVFGVLAILLALVNAIMSFCSLKLVGLDDSSYITLGAGSIIFGIFDIIVFILLIAGLVTLSQYNNTCSASSSQVPSSSRTGVTNTMGTSSEPSVDSTSQKDPIQTLKEAKELLDSGAISQEEYDQLKAKYLKKL